MGNILQEGSGKGFEHDAHRMDQRNVSLGPHSGTQARTGRTLATASESLVEFGMARAQSAVV
jgi:hypothetical protein